MQAPKLVVVPETFVPACPSSAWARLLAGWTVGPTGVERHDDAPNFDCPQTGNHMYRSSEEPILDADLDRRRLDEEPQRFDPAGHDRRADVLELRVGARREHKQR